VAGLLETPRAVGSRYDTELGHRIWLFTQGEAPLVLSYSTSPAYHKAYENSERFKALQFTEAMLFKLNLQACSLPATKKSLHSSLSIFCSLQSVRPSYLKRNGCFLQISIRNFLHPSGCARVSDFTSNNSRYRK